MLGFPIRGYLRKVTFLGHNKAKLLHLTIAKPTLYCTKFVLLTCPTAMPLIEPIAKIIVDTDILFIQ